MISTFSRNLLASLSFSNALSLASLQLNALLLVPCYNCIANSTLAYPSASRAAARTLASVANALASASSNAESTASPKVSCDCLNH